MVVVNGLSGTFGTYNISVAENRYVDERVLLDSTYQSPIGISSVHLCTRATMNAKGGNAGILQFLCKVDDNFVVVVPT